MLKEKNQSLYSLSNIAALLSSKVCEPLPDASGRTRASVALVLRSSSEELELLFIQRASHDLDPWSGHIAFPGGKWEEGELVCQTARRETLEEIGIDLGEESYLGRLSDIVGSNLPVRVSCCVYGLENRVSNPVLSAEVSDVFWVGLSDLLDSRRHQLAPVTFDGKRFDVPAIRLPVEGKPVLWGITYRLVMQFLEVLEGAGTRSCK